MIWSELKSVNTHLLYALATWTADNFFLFTSVYIYSSMTMILMKNEPLWAEEQIFLLKNVFKFYFGILWICFLSTGLSQYPLSFKRIFIRSIDELIYFFCLLF